jgi:hypothetical protein
MPSNDNEVLCPLCHGQGRSRKEVLVVRWRSRQFDHQMQKMSDEAAFGASSGLDVLFEAEEPVYSNESD